MYVISGWGDCPMTRVARSPHYGQGGGARFCFTMLE